MKALSTILLVVVLTACAADPSAGPPTPAPAPTAAPTGPLPTLPPCEYPEEIPLPEWLPKGLPFPEGTYGMEDLEPLAGYERALMVIPESLDEVIDFVLERWPEKGWELGVGDVEPAEVEEQFSKGESVGAFKAQSVFCDPGFVIMYLIFAKEAPTPGAAPGIPSPRGSPLNPPSSPD